MAKGSQLYRTKEGEKAGVEMRYLPDATVCEINGKPAFEIRRKGAAALKMTAELFTFDGAFLKWSDEFIEGFVIRGEDQLKIGGCTFRNCGFRGVVGIQIGDAKQPLPTAIKLALPS